MPRHHHHRHHNRQHHGRGRAAHAAGPGGASVYPPAYPVTLSTTALVETIREQERGYIKFVADTPADEVRIIDETYSSISPEKHALLEQFSVAYADLSSKYKAYLENSNDGNRRIGDEIRHLDRLKSKILHFPNIPRDQAAELSLLLQIVLKRIERHYERELSLYYGWDTRSGASDSDNVAAETFANNQGPGEVPTSSTALTMPGFAHALPIDSEGGTLESSSLISGSVGTPTIFGLDITDRALTGLAGPLVAGSVAFHEFLAIREVLQNDDLTDEERRMYQAERTDVLIRLGEVTAAVFHGLGTTANVIVQKVPSVEQAVKAAEAANTLATATQVGASVTGGLSASLGFLQLGITIYGAEKTRKRVRELEKLLKNNVVQSSLEENLAYAIRKNNTKWRRKVAIGVEFGLSGLAGVGAIVGGTVVGAAAVTNPIGWALASAALLIGLGIGGYKVGNKVRKHYHRKGKAKQLVKDLRQHDMAAHLTLRELGISPLETEEMLINGGKDKLIKDLTERFKAKRERLAYGLFQAFQGNGTQTQQMEARRIIAALMNKNYSPLELMNMQNFSSIQSEDSIIKLLESW